MFNKIATLSKQIKKEPLLFYLNGWLILTIINQFDRFALTNLLVLAPVLIVNRKRIFHSCKKLPLLSVFWLLFIVYCLFASWFYSTIINFSIIELINQITYFFAFFLFVDLFAEKKVRIDYFLTILINIFTFCIIISFVIQLFTDSQQLNNILASFLPYYGHNHFASTLLLFFPYVCYKYLQTKRKKNLSFFILWTLFLLLSAGRVVLVLGFFELLIVVLVTCKTLKIPKTVYASIVVWVFSLLWFVYFNSMLLCTNNYSNNFCKIPHFETRFNYWEQAMQIIKNQPYFGSGLGTFGNESRKYLQTSRYKTDYAHNLLLQLTAEVGLMGLVVLGLVALTTLLELKKRKTKLTLNKYNFFLMVGLIIFIINGMFDFDLSLTGNIILLISIIALLISSNNEQLSQVTKNHKYFDVISQLFINLLLGLFVIGTIVLTSQRILISMHLYDLAVSISPYTIIFPKEKIEELLKYISPINKQKTDLVYRNLVDYWLIRVNENEYINKPEQRAIIISHINTLYPWSRINSNNAKYYISINEQEKSLEELKENLDFIKEKADSEKFKFPLYYYWRVTNDLISLTRLLLKEGKYFKAKEAVTLALSVNKDLLAEIDPVISPGNLEMDEIKYFEFISESKPVNLGSNTQDYKDRIIKLLDKATGENQSSISVKALNLLLILSPKDYWVATQLGNYYVSIGELDKAQQAFDACLQQFNYQHDDCAGGKQAILDGNPNKERFFQVSQIILGEKRWQDFQ